VDRSTAEDALARLFDLAGELIEMLEQAVRRGDVELASLKSQCFDLMFEAIAAGATRLSTDGSSPLQERSRAIVERLTGYQQAFADVRLHLIDLAEDWRCSVCGRDVAGGITVVNKAPLTAAVVCRACGAKSPLTERGQQRLQELFGPLVSAVWDPAVNGFIV